MTAGMLGFAVGVVVGLLAAAARGYVPPIGTAPPRPMVTVAVVEPIPPDDPWYGHGWGYRVRGWGGRGSPGVGDVDACRRWARELNLKAAKAGVEAK